MSTESTVTHILSKLLYELPVVVDEVDCNYCSSRTSQKGFCLPICLTANLQELSTYLNQTLEDQRSQCKKCQESKTVKRILSKTFLIIELVDFINTDRASGILREYETKPCELPATVVVQEVEYILRGFLGFCGRTTSFTSVGHYVAYARRSNDTWELYDDTKDSKSFVSPSKQVPCQVLVYSI
ncbi:uncharacterized protein LOC129005821 [Macrosteles quadrilineatus]|uniref:uncharacterized protein LOC129005821 n=1 Tax=Macrosteles quadrilineatus TaxID=74068 RepID=UPI0023E2602E|nr:uncharacterized protein LOC129005821 [Macrosteles quadrilineatus]